MHTRKNLILFCLTGFLIALFLSIFTYRNLALWLFLSDPLPQHLDYICTFAGSSDREPYSIELLKKFKDATWIVNNNSRRFKKWATQNGIDSNRILITPICNSTLEEINSFKEIITRREKSNGLRSSPIIGFVSSPYHMRRISVLFALSRNKFFKNGFFLPVPIEKTSFSKEKLRVWWKDTCTKRVVTDEIKKMAGNIILKIPLLGDKLKKLASK